MKIFPIWVTHCRSQENEYYCKDGSPLWTDVFVHPHMGGKSKSSTILGVTRDITERKQFEARLLEQTNDLKELIAAREKFFLSSHMI